MNDTLQQAVAQIIERAVAGIDTASAFLSDQLPDVVHQLLLWYGVSSFITFIIALAVFIISMVYIAKFCMHKRPEPDTSGRRYVATFYNDTCGDVTPIAGGLVFVSALAGLISVIVTINSTEWFKILLAPKVWLLEYASKLIS